MKGKLDFEHNQHTVSNDANNTRLLSMASQHDVTTYMYDVTYTV